MASSIRVGLLTFLLSIGTVQSASAIQYKFVDSPVLGLWSFVLGATPHPIGSPILIEFYKKSKFHNLETDRSINEAADIIDNYLNQGFDFSLQVQGRREQGWDAKKHFDYQASIANSLNDFEKHTADLLPYDQQKKLFVLLKKLEPIYRQLIWKPSKLPMEAVKSQINKDLLALNKDKVLDQIKNFYQSSLPSDTVLPIHLIPIPEKEGNSHATVIGGEVFAQFFTKQAKPDIHRTGVIVHETAHFFYETQSVEFQKKHLDWFSPDKIEYSKYLYQIWDEVLATATGNGYADKIINHKLDADEWYANIEYNGMSKALYPKAEEYLTKNKPIDKDFIDYSISIYQKQFPRAKLAYARILKQTLLIFDENGFQLKEVRTPLKWIFRPSAIQACDSGDSKKIETELKNGAPKEAPDDRYASLLIVAKPEHRKNILKNLTLDSAIKESIQNSSMETGFITFDRKGALPVVYVQANSEEGIKAVFKAMRGAYSIPDKPLFKQPL